MLKSAVIAGAACLAAGLAVRAENAFPPEQIQFFESKIRPVLAENCHRCHGPEHQNNGLRLDSRAAVLRGSDYGPVVVAGNPDGSKLIHAIRQDQPNVEAMPKKAAKLPQPAIDALTEWVRLGLPWPEEAAPPTHRAAADPKLHWAYQKVVMPAIPEVTHNEQVYQPMDAFVVRKLEENGLSLSPKSDRPTRLRRLYLDLVGFPPDFEEVEAFAKDPAPDAYVRQVDKLLASPHFGERWARYWLDIARYADTKGYVFQEERRYPYAYTYRDWVIRAFNADMPYDRFLINQIAADQANPPGPEGTANLAALGFLTLGRRFLNNEPDIIDDRLDVVFRGTQAVTIGCARCHDHKNDPIPSQDYYGLYGVFASSMEPKELPEVGPVERTPEVVKFEEELAKRQAKVGAYRQERHAKLSEPEVLEKYLTAATECLHKTDGETQQLAKDRGLYFNVVKRWQGLLKRGETDRVFACWNAMVKIPAPEFAVKAKALLESPDADEKFLPAVVREMKPAPPATLAEAAKVYARLFAQAMPPDGVCRAELEPVKRLMAAPEGLMGIKPEELEPFYTRPEREKLREIQKDIENFKASSPAAPPRAMAMLDKPQPVEPVVFIRGNPGRHGPRVPRQFLQILSGGDRKPFTKGSGRLELAQAIASPDNPLTARVFVNRAWAKLLGQPLVDTPSDFGLRTPVPANQPLLDYLAASFMQNGWSMKKLLREILLSATYQQQSQLRPDGAARDPENRLCWRMNRKRLDFEAMRDSLLKVSGGLDPAQFGKPIDLLAQPFSGRRTIYGFIDRQNLPGTLRTFDFASPDQHAARRFETTVPQQALYFLNSPFVEQQAKRLADNLNAGAGLEERVRNLIRRAFAREATPEEISLGAVFAKHAPPVSQTSNAWSYGFGDWDPAGKAVRFTAFPWHGEGRWAGGAKLPDPQLGYCFLHAEGGHPGDPGKAAIRRWTPAMPATTVKITGDASVGQAQSSGIVVRIISSRSGVLGEWKVAGGATVPVVLKNIPIAAGEVLDFVADCGGDTNCDGFRWSPRILDAAGRELANAKREFSGPAKGIDPWQSYAQALLCANEFLFVD